MKYLRFLLVASLVSFTLWNSLQTRTVKHDVQAIKNSQVLGFNAIQAQNYFPSTNSTSSAATTSNFIGNILPASNNAYDLGSATREWRNLYIAGTFNNSSTVSTNVTTTNLYVSGLTNLAGALTFTTASGTSITSTNLYVANRLGINSSSPVATLGIKGLAGVNLLAITSSTGANLLTLKTNGRFEVGPNSLAQTGYFTVDSGSNDIAVQFTNGTHYTGGFGRVAGTSGQMFMGGYSGTSLYLMANGGFPLSLPTTGFAGFNTTTPIDDVAMAGSATTTLVIDSTSSTAGACIMLKDSDGSGYTYVTAANGVLTASVNSCR